jgi:hypothetical protein
MTEFSSSFESDQYVSSLILLMQTFILHKVKKLFLFLLIIILYKCNLWGIINIYLNCVYKFMIYANLHDFLFIFNTIRKFRIELHVKPEFCMSSAFLNYSNSIRGQT